MVQYPFDFGEAESNGEDKSANKCLEGVNPLRPEADDHKKTDHDQHDATEDVDGADVPL